MKIINFTLSSTDADSRIKKELETQKHLFDQLVVFSVNSTRLEILPDSSNLKHFIVKHNAGRILNIPGSGLLTEYILYVKVLLKNKAEFHSSHIYHCNDLNALFFGWIAMFFNKNVKVIYDAHEFETEQVANPNRFLHFLSIQLERLLLKRVAAVITVSEGIAREYAKRYGIPKPRLVLNCPPFQVVKKTDKFREKFAIGSEKKIFLYQGALHKGRGLEKLLDVFAFRQRQNAVIVMMGYGDMAEQIQMLASRYDTIYYHPAVLPSEVLSYTASADIGFSPVIPNPCLSYYYSLSNKIFEYAMAGLPMLVGNLVEISRLVREFDCGQVIEDETQDGIDEAIDHMLSSDLEKYAANARILAQQFNWGEQEKVLLSVYKGVLSCAE